MALQFFALAQQAVQQRNKLGEYANTATNTLGFTKGTCGMMPTAEQLAHVIAAADPSETPMRKIRERFGRSGEGGKYGGTRETAIYRAPISEVLKWFVYDCASAGDIRQDMAKDFGILWAKYGGTLGQVAPTGQSSTSGWLEPHPISALQPTTSQVPAMQAASVGGIPVVLLLAGAVVAGLLFPRS